MTEDTRRSLEDPESENHTRPQNEIRPVAPDDGVDRLSEGGGNHPLSPHPNGAEDCPANDGTALPARDPHEETDRRAQIRISRVGERNPREHVGGEV
jgi:hypothetical protein